MVRTTVGALEVGGSWSEQVYEITVIPGDDPNVPPAPTDGPGSPGWVERCLEEQAHVRAYSGPVTGG